MNINKTISLLIQSGVFNSKLRIIAASLLLILSQQTFAASSQTINLRFGWNLISFHVLPEDKSPANVLAALEANGTLDSLWEYNSTAQSWLTYPSPVPGSPAIINLATGKGYWVKVTSPTILNITDPSNNLPTAPMNLQLGWNLFGSVSDVAQPYKNVFQGVAVEEIWQFNAQFSEFKGVQIPVFGAEPTLEEFTELLPGAGYWVLVTQLSDIEPVLGTSLPGDVDVEPLIPDFFITPGIPTPWAEMGPGDVDVGEDGLYDLTDTQRTVDLRDNLDRQNLSISNSNTGILSYRVSVLNPLSTPWLKLLVTDEQTGEESLVNEVNGAVTTSAAIVQIAGDRAGLLPGQVQGQLLVESNGDFDNQPVRTIDVKMGVADLAGDYKVTVNIDTVNGNKADLHNPRLFMSLYRDADGLKAIIDDKKTLLVPQKVHLTGDSYQDGTNNFTVSGSFSLPASGSGLPGANDNPYDTELRRDITLLGDRAGFEEGGALDLVGDYRETIRNVLGQPIYLRGTFVATRQGAIPTAQDKDTSGNQTTLPIDQNIQESVINVSSKLLLTGVEVTTNITHTRATDIRVTLISPNLTEVILRQAGSTLSLGTQIYSTEDIPFGNLDDFAGEFSEGAWTLRVDDVVAGETGTLNSWDLNLSGTSVYDITGTVSGVGTGATVVLTGCGVVLTTTTAADGTYAFNNAINCVYSVTIQKEGFEGLSQTIVVNGQNVIGTDFSPATVDSEPPIVVSAPTDGINSLLYISTYSSAGLVTRLTTPEGIQLGGEDAHDSATFDIDRPPFGFTGSNCGQITCPVEDTNYFSSVIDSQTGTNKLEQNGNIDGPVGSGTHYRMSVSIGSAIIGRSVSGNQQLLIGANQ